MAQGRILIAAVAMVAFCGNSLALAQSAVAERQGSDARSKVDESPDTRMVSLIDAIRKAESKTRGSALSAFVSGIDGMTYVVDVMNRGGIDQVKVNAHTGQLTISPIKRSPTWSPMHPIFTSSPGG